MARMKRGRVGRGGRAYVVCSNKGHKMQPCIWRLVSFFSQQIPLAAVGNAMIALLKSPARRCGAIFAATWLLACAAGAATISTNDQGSASIAARWDFHPSISQPNRAVRKRDHKIISKEPPGRK